MGKIEGVYYGYKNKDNLNLSDADIIRFNIDELNYIDVQFKDGTLNINGSSSIQIMPTASNSIDIKIKEINGI